MIIVNRLDGSEFVINALLIESVERTPDTIITLTTGKKLIVSQSVEEIIQRFEDFIRRTHMITYK
ncbi:flagellar FlbD family protein [Tepidibacillus infernus]|uniref:Endoflagellar protein n=1 Tax=Tepidibacillus decaturensis TaxID=1413211 RepID=A0A135L2Z7_9BACI|nr:MULTISPECIES: flagellar FlbD family protein [Tepidibacillus]KXG43394.1 endoflagellar protein [Tepidibacillus decaturensis]GBF11608.1 flagellar protein [Tepidibacillus sp. HK-1]